MSTFRRAVAQALRARSAWVPRLATLALGLWLLTTGVVAEEADLEAQITAGIERYDALLVIGDDLRAALDRTLFDLDELALAFAFDDIADIATWVEREIHYEPYAGLLRGPEGTLRARAGNALDQAVLLASLLNSVGYEARIALGTLDDATADALLSRTHATRVATPAIGDRGRIEAAVRELADLLSLDPTGLLEDLQATFEAPPVGSAALLAEVAARAAEIEQALVAAGIQMGGAGLRDEIRAYAWVEARVGPAHAWEPLHPTGLTPSVLPEVEQILTDNVPEALMHRIRIEAWIERKEGEELIRVPIMDAWERPAATAAGIVIDYANAPNGYLQGPIGTFDLEAVLAETNFFAPNLFGRVAPGGLFFDLDGRALAPVLAGDQAAKFVQTVGRAVESATSALGGIGLGGAAPTADPDDLIALVGHGLDITLIAPDGSEVTPRRWLLDRLGAANRAAGQVAIDDADVNVGRALLRHQRIVVQTGGSPQGYLLDAALADLEARRELFAFTLGQALAPDSATTLTTATVGRESPLDHLLLFDLFNRPSEVAGGNSGFRPAPAIVNLSRYLSDDDALVYSIDILSNAHRQVEGASVDISAAIRRGVWETIAEREALRDEDALRMRAAADAAGPFAVIRPGDAVAVGDFGLNASQLRSLQADLARGSSVLLPHNVSEVDAWWRIDPASGTTLGVSGDGRGQTLTEYTIQLYDMGFTVMFAAKGLNDCMKLGGQLEQACCLVKAHVNNVTGLGLGTLVGGAFGGGAGLVFTLTTGFGNADFVGPLTGLDCGVFAGP